jgi:ketosteroid isomerase-like protein
VSGNAEDRIAIAELAAAYSAAANRRAARDMERVLTPDAALGGVAKLVGRADAEVVGARAIGDLFEAAFEALELVHQMPQVADLRVDGDRATATTMVVEYVRPKGGPLMLMLGNYEDTLVRTLAGWRFSRRDFRVKYFGALAAPAVPITPR